MHFSDEGYSIVCWKVRYIYCCQIDKVSCLLYASWTCWILWKIIILEWNLTNKEYRFTYIIAYNWCTYFGVNSYRIIKSNSFIQLSTAIKFLSLLPMYSAILVWKHAWQEETCDTHHCARTFYSDKFQKLYTISWYFLFNCDVQWPSSST